MGSSWQTEVGSKRAACRLQLSAFAHALFKFTLPLPIYPV